MRLANLEQAQISDGSTDIMTQEDEGALSLATKVLENRYGEDLELCEEVEMHEFDTLKEYREMDIFHKRGEGKKAKFSQMTLDENLSYIKRDFGTLDEALLMFNETNEAFEGPEIASAII